MIVLTSLSYSPWSEKARWALDHHQIVYKKENYVPLFGELKLRFRLRKLSGRITVPVLFDGQTYYTDSYDIARFADRIGGGTRLFPDDKLAEITEWNRRSEAALAAGRALLMLSKAQDSEFALGFLPVPLPPALKPVMVPLAKKGMSAFIDKYKMRDEASTHEAVFTRELERFEKALTGPYLVGDAFSYADIAMALVVQGISPVDDRYMMRVPGTGDNAFTNELKRRYKTLISWRDELYVKHRRRLRTDA